MLAPYWQSEGVTLYHGDCRAVLATLPAESVQCVTTSPPFFGLRNYNGGEQEIGAEGDLDAYVGNLVAVFREVRRVLRDDGVCWVNLGDAYSSGGRGSYAADYKNPIREIDARPCVPLGLKSKDLIGVPWRVAFAFQADGWYLRSAVVWHKPNAFPESVKDRPTMDYEMVFLLSKRAAYYYDAAAIKEPHGYNRWGTKRLQDASVLNAVYDGQAGSSSILRKGPINTFPDGGRNKRAVWSVPTQPLKAAHFAAWPEKLVEPMILAGSRKGDAILDPFVGSGRSGIVARRLGRHFIGIDLNAFYLDMSRTHIGAVQPFLMGIA